LLTISSILEPFPENVLVFAKAGFTQDSKTELPHRNRCTSGTHQLKQQIVLAAVDWHDMSAGYGSYGLCVEPEFRLTNQRLPMIDRGVTLCLAHVRGGGEMGRERWYEDGGKYLQKRNTFTDFIAAARLLVDQGLTTPSMLAIEGRSAGGLLVGAAINLEPTLFTAALAAVPFTDVLTTMRDATIPLTVGEWEEWGNPYQRDFYEYIASYSPIDNVPEGELALR
jgi:oligopeptidase B